MFIEADKASELLHKNGSVSIRVKRQSVRHVKFTMLADGDVAICVANMARISRMPADDAHAIIMAMNDITSIA